MKNFTNNFKQFTSRLSAGWLIMALMLLLGTSSAWAANEYGMRYLYVDCKSFTNYTQVNADMFWQVDCNEKAEYKSPFPTCPNDNNVFYVDLKSLNSSSYANYRAFEISQGSGWWNKKCFSVPANNKNNSIKISGWGAGSWSNFALTPSSVTLKVTSGATGGTGAQNDPYLVEVGTQFTLSASNLTFNPADPVMVGRYSFGTSTKSNPTGTSTTSDQTASSTANTITQYYVSVRGYYNGVYSSSYKTASVYVKTVASCAPSTSITSATLQQDGTIKLEGDFTTCGAKFHGFQWRKSTADWCNDGDETQDFSNYVKIGNTEGSEGEEKVFTPIQGDTYVFRTYIYNNGSWIYSTETKEVSTCVSVVEPAVTRSPANGEVCQGYPITLTLTTRQSGVVYKVGEDEIFESTTTYSFIPNTSSVTVTASSTNACAGTNDKTKTFSISIKSLPEAPVFANNSMTVCAGEPFTLPTPTNLKVGTEDCIWSVGGKTTTGNQPGISQTTVYTAVKNDGCPSPSEEFTVNVTPKPTITASKASCAPYEVITLSSAAGPGTTWSTDGGMLSATSGASVTFKAAPGTPYTVTASANGCTDTETITVECAAEECETQTITTTSNKIEIRCKETSGNSTLKCYAWYWDGSKDVLLLGDWPGSLPNADDETYSGTTYKSWSIDMGNKTNEIWIIFSNNGGNQSDNIDKDMQKNNKYYFTYNDDSNDKSKNWSYVTKTSLSKTETSTVATNPTVTTVSAEQKEGEAAVVIKGFLQATGCADITKYGYQYRVQGSGDFTDVLIDGSKNKCEEWTAELTDLEYGETYEFRAMATNSSKEGTGEEIQVTIQGQSTPVVIKAVRNDRTINESHWADFVALYVQEDGITAAGAKEVENYTWEYSTDGTNWSTNFTGYVLGGASATVGVTNGSEKCNNIRPTKTGKYRVKVTYDNTKEQYSNIITITNDGFKLKYPKYGQNAGSEFAFDAASRTIPVFVVKTTENFPDCPASGMPSQDVEGQKAKKSVDVKIFDNGNVVYDRKARMNYRGSSSLNFRKKSYAFCTGKEKTKNNKGDVDTDKANLFGLSDGAEDKDWVLYAAMPDPSMMRNRLIFDTYAQMTGKWGVNSMFVELIIDDEYMGVYVLMDKITNNEKRVYVGTYGDDEKKDYNGGFILKFDKTDVTDRFEDENSEKRNTFTTEKTGKSGIGSYGATFDQRFEIEYPEMEDLGTEKWVEFVNDNVKGKIEAFEKALEAGNYTEVRKLIDYTSWADWFIISEFAKNVDAYRASCFFVYNGDKIEARPLWDQELSFDNTATTVGNGKGCNSLDGLLIQNSGVYSDDFPAPFWFIGHTDKNKSSTITGGLLNDPCFVTMVKNRYKDHLNNALSNGQLTGKISDYQDELTDAAKTRETNTWRPGEGNIYSCNNGDTSYDYVSITNSITAMTDWITNRPAKLTTALDALTGSSVNISIEPSFVETYPWEPFTLTVDAPEGYEYEMAFTKEGADATGNMVVVKGGDIYTVKIKRPANTLSQLFETVPYLATATLKVADDGCGGMTTPEANVNIRLNDRVEDECPQPSPAQ